MSVVGQAAAGGFDGEERTSDRYAIVVGRFYEELADRFHEVRLALNHLSDELLNLDDDGTASLLL